ncbi:MAG TPA: hypothetical protein VFH95_07905 [Candidatus Kapabacteria bacterium]|nr:hypothetical protein [Candidatus Kapabacteria bacterium]
MNFQFTDHALMEIAKRRIPMEFVEQTLENPEQIVPERRGRKGYQARKRFSNGRTYFSAGYCRYGRRAANRAHRLSNK